MDTISCRYPTTQISPRYSNPVSFLSEMCDYLDPELDLLGNDFEGDDEGGTQHALRTAPVFTGDAFDLLGPGIMPQRALYGRVISQHAPHFPTKPLSPKIYINTNAPFSALVCGVQVSVRMLTADCCDESLTPQMSGVWEEPLDVCNIGKLSNEPRATWNAPRASQCPCVSYIAFPPFN